MTTTTRIITDTMGAAANHMKAAVLNFEIAEALYESANTASHEIVRAKVHAMGTTVDALEEADLDTLMALEDAAEKETGLVSALTLKHQRRAEFCAAWAALIVASKIAEPAEEASLASNLGRSEDDFRQAIDLGQQYHGASA
jgi:hypothetical protein